jgi:L-threonylcarbamoyladenylate synthase
MENDLKFSLETLKQGKLLLYPTDTVWGIGCDATNVDAVNRIFEIKKRNESKSLVILVDSIEMLHQIIPNIPIQALEWIKISPKPTTVIYHNPVDLASNVIAVDNTVGIRIVQDEFCKELIRKFGKPIVSTSANISGEPTPAFFKEISNEIKKAVDYIVKWHQDETKQAESSSIVKIEANGEIVFIRK